MGYRSPIPLIDLSAICTMTEELRDQSLLIPTDSDSNGPYTLFSLVLYHELGKGPSHEMNGRMGYRSPIPLIDLSAICTMTEELRDQSLLIPTDD